MFFTHLLVNAMEVDHPRGTLMTALTAKKNNEDMGLAAYDLADLQKLQDKIIHLMDEKNQQENVQFAQHLALSPSSLKGYLGEIQNSIKSIKAAWISLLLTRKIQNQPIGELLSAADAMLLSNSINQILNKMDDKTLSRIESQQLTLSPREIKQQLRLLTQELVAPSMQKVAPAKSKTLAELQPRKSLFSPQDEATIKRFSLLFNELPKEYYARALEYLKSKSDLWLKKLDADQKDDAQRNKELFMLIGDTYKQGRPLSYFASGYVFFPINKKARLKNSIEVQRKLSPVVINKVMAMEAVNAADKELKKKLIEEFANGYKIHLMPAPGTNLAKLIILIFDEFSTDPELKNYVEEFKVAISNDEESRKNQFPVVVFYSNDGTEAAQKALNKIFNFLKKHPEIKGSGDRPRYNGKVNDLIWIAQGDGDSKRISWNDQFFELPLKIYYKSDLTGIVKNYHLKNPETGKEIID